MQPSSQGPLPPTQPTLPTYEPGPAPVTPVNVVDAVVQAIQTMVDNSGTRWLQASFVAEETDPKLSYIIAEGIEHHNVRKLKHVGTLTANDQCLVLVAKGMPIVIVGVITGDIVVDSTLWFL